jgi:hypothetical protein
MQLILPPNNATTHLYTSTFLLIWPLSSNSGGMWVTVPAGRQAGRQKRRRS